MDVFVSWNVRNDAYPISVRESGADGLEIYCCRDLESTLEYLKALGYPHVRVWDNIREPMGIQRTREFFRQLNDAGIRYQIID